MCERRHYAAWIGESYAESDRVTDCDLATYPVVLNEPGFLASDDYVHPEPALVETATGLKAVKLIKRGCSQHRNWEKVKERTDGHGRREASLIEECRPELLFDDGISVACGVRILDVWVILVDSEVIRRRPGQRDVSSKKC